MNKKAQMEIMGLVIIVALLLLGMFFAMKYLTREPETITQASDKQMAIAFLNTLLAKNLYVDDCKTGIELNELIKDCAKQTQQTKNMCQDGTTTYCEKASAVIQDILVNTFEANKKPYQFEVKLQDSTGPSPISISYDCNGQNKDPVYYQLPTEQGTVMIWLSICS